MPDPTSQDPRRSVSVLRLQADLGQSYTPSEALGLIARIGENRMAQLQIIEAYLAVRPAQTRPS